MYDVILFGGTTEGRLLSDELCRLQMPSLVCTATEYGGELVNITSPVVQLNTSRLSKDEMLTLFRKECPGLVIDATHPYAVEVTASLRSACKETGTPYLRVLRETLPVSGCTRCQSMKELVSLLNHYDGKIFSALGAKEAAALTAVKDFKKRVILRILPQSAPLEHCLSLGYPPSSLICMQGPFSEELNLAMFRETGARILLTKESGAKGGFEEKLSAAKVCGMKVFVLSRPPEAEGVTLSRAIATLGELNK